MADGIQDRTGVMLEQRIDDIEERAAERRFGPAALGIAMAFGVVTGGIGTFVLVLFVLVHFFA